MNFIGKLQGKNIIDKLDINSLESGIHHFYFEACKQNTSIPICIPVMVAVGKKKGKTLLLNSGIHGDELNGVSVIHKVFKELDTEKMSGNILAVTGMNATGIFLKARYFRDSKATTGMTDLNRIMPGKKDGSLAEQFVNAIWENLYINNADYAIDLHSGGTGSVFSLFAFCDSSKGDMPKKMIDSIQPDTASYDPGAKGILETELVKAGIPAITLELGTNTKDKVFIDKAYKGIMNLLTDIDIFHSDIKPEKKETIWGDTLTELPLTDSGYIDMHVKLLDHVKKGQLLLTQSNAFGEKLVEYKAPFDAHIVILSQEQLMDSGSKYITLLHCKDKSGDNK